MLKAHWRLISYLERIGDNLLVCLAFFLTYYLRDFVLGIGFIRDLTNTNIAGELLSLGPIEYYFVILGIALPVYNAGLSLFGAYRSMRFQRYLEVFRTATLISFIVFLCEGAFLYLLKLDLSRSFVAIFCLLSGVFLFAERALVLLLLRYFRVRGKNYRNILIVGTGEQARALYKEITSQRDLGIKVVGFTSLDEFSDYKSHVYDLPARTVASPESFEGALKRYTVDEVLFTDVLSAGSAIQGLAQIAIEEGVRVSFAADLFSLEIFKSEVSFFSGIPVVHYHPSRGGSDSVQLVLKRMFDVVVASVLIIITSPIMLLTALAIKLDSSGPIFYKPRRVGLNGRIFTLIKFRSMIDGADKMLDELRDKNEMSGPAFKMSNDPRLTRVGAFIRRYSIDELPQLFNVLAGDMSLVGPRPPLPHEVALYERKHRRRLSMRPGLTCTWQVSGRNNIPDFDEWTRLDLEYIDNWSFSKDMLLLLRTIPAVISGTGAR